MTKLTFIKTIHTTIWLFFNAVLCYLIYAVLANKMDVLVWVAIGFIFIEGTVLAIFKGQCPLTIVARKYSDSQKENFDIYLPNWLAKYNKIIYTIIFIIIIIGLICRIAVG